jgi:hypothetical protein
VRFALFALGSAKAMRNSMAICPFCVAAAPGARELDGGLVCNWKVICPVRQADAEAAGHFSSILAARNGANYTLLRTRWMKCR